MPNAPVTPVSVPPPAGRLRHSSNEERERRIGLLRAAMDRDGLDALVVCGRDDIRYRGRTFWVSDVWQLMADTHVVILPDDGPIFIGGQVFGIEQAEILDWPTEFRLSGHPGTEIADVLKSRGLDSTTVGIVGLSDASFAAAHLAQLTDALPSVEIRDATVLFEDARHGNSEEELSYSRSASALWNEVYAAIEPSIKPGMTEIALAAECHRVAREAGLRDPMVILQSTPNDVMSFGTTKVIEEDDVICIWIESASPSGYWLEYRRNYSFGPPADEYREFWELSKEATVAGLRKMTPGAMASEFVAEVQRVLQERSKYSLGYADPMNPHSMYSIHGIGSDAIYGVWVPGNDRVLVENEIGNIHPVVTFDDHAEAKKFAWLGITDNVLVTPEGGVFMTHEEDVRHGFVQL